MKFKAVMTDITAMQSFSKLLMFIGRISKTVSLRLTPTHFYFICNERSSQSRSNLWCEMPQAQFFSWYYMEGISEQYNEIVMELTVDFLITVFKSTQTAKGIKMKLSKKGTALLSCEVELPAVSSRSRFVIHDIPVSMIAKKYWNEYQEPNVSEFDVSFYIPSLRVMRSVVDRMKNISTYLMLIANSLGDLTLKVETDTVSISTHFKNLELITTVENEDSDSSQVAAETRVDIRKVSQFLFGQNINPRRVICNFINNRSIHFFLLTDDASVQFILPSIAA